MSLREVLIATILAVPILFIVSLIPTASQAQYYCNPASCRPQSQPTAASVERIKAEIEREVYAQIRSRVLAEWRQEVQLVEPDELAARIRAEVLTQVMRELRAAIDELPKPEPPKPVNLDGLAQAVIPKLPPTWFVVRYVNRETGQAHDQTVWTARGNQRPSAANGFTFTDHGLSPVKFP